MTRCLRCKRELLDPAALAAAADQMRVAVAGAVSLAQANPGSGIERAYGGGPGLLRALAAQLDKAEALSLELARATACLAGTCLMPPANAATEPRR